MAGSRQVRGRRFRAAAWVVPVLTAVVFRGDAMGQVRRAPAEVQSVLEVGITVADLERSVAFFTEVLTFEKVGESVNSGSSFDKLTGLTSAQARTARLKLGEEFIELTEFDSPRGRPVPEDSRSNDLWFQHIAIIVADMEKAHTSLHRSMVRHASIDPQTLPAWNRNAAGIKAFYFRDPDGHFLELLEFPPDKGDPKWRRETDRLFLGIDHTAIVVSDTESSLGFYRDKLGMRVVGAGDNYGMEQEALNNVPGAHLRITTLRAAQGPAIELLEYLQPRDGRPAPPDAAPNDLIHWHTTLALREVRPLVESLPATDPKPVSASVVEFEDRSGPHQAAVLLRDPDGHVLKLAEKRAHP